MQKKHRTRTRRDMLSCEDLTVAKTKLREGGHTAKLPYAVGEFPAGGFLRFCLCLSSLLPHIPPLISHLYSRFSLVAEIEREGRGERREKREVRRERRDPEMREERRGRREERLDLRNVTGPRCQWQAEQGVGVCGARARQEGERRRARLWPECEENIVHDGITPALLGPAADDAWGGWSGAGGVGCQGIPLAICAGEKHHNHRCRRHHHGPLLTYPYIA